MGKMTVLILLIALFCNHCATDVVVSTGVAAEQKNQEIEQSQETKKKVETGVEDSLKKEEARKKQLNNL